MTGAILSDVYSRRNGTHNVEIGHYKMGIKVVTVENKTLYGFLVCPKVFWDGDILKKPLSYLFGTRPAAE